jgi:hypothetical protein
MGFLNFQISCYETENHYLFMVNYRKVLINVNCKFMLTINICLKLI